MDRDKLKAKSKNLDDRTGYTALDHFLNQLFVSLNPLYAARKVRGKMLEDGLVEPKKRINWK